MLPTLPPISARIKNMDSGVLKAFLFAFLLSLPMARKLITLIIPKYTKINSFSRTNNIFKRSPNLKKYRNLEDTEITKEEMQSAKQIKINKYF